MRKASTPPALQSGLPRPLCLLTPCPTDIKRPSINNRYRPSTRQEASTSPPQHQQGTCRAKRSTMRTTQPALTSSVSCIAQYQHPTEEHDHLIEYCVPSPQHQPTRLELSLDSTDTLRGSFSQARTTQPLVISALPRTRHAGVGGRIPVL